MHTYLTHAYKTVDELKTLFPNQHFRGETGERTPHHSNGTNHRKQMPTIKTVIKLYHPVYNLYVPDPGFDTERFKKSSDLRNTFLFFGLFEKYKGLHMAIEAFSEVAKSRNDVSFLICGEFWTADQINGQPN